MLLGRDSTTLSSVGDTAVAESTSFIWAETGTVHLVLT